MGEERKNKKSHLLRSSLNWCWTQFCEDWEYRGWQLLGNSFWTAERAADFLRGSAFGEQGFLTTPPLKDLKFEQREKERKKISSYNILTLNKALLLSSWRQMLTMPKQKAPPPYWNIILYNQTLRFQHYPGVLAHAHDPSSWTITSADIFALSRTWSQSSSPFSAEPFWWKFNQRLICMFLTKLLMNQSLCLPLITAGKGKKGVNRLHTPGGHTCSCLPTLRSLPLYFLIQY